MAPRGVLYITLILLRSVLAIPTIAFPLNSQVPPVARVSEPFSYTFSSSTFFSTLPLSYALSIAPDWLSLDSNTRTLSGTPSSEDADQGTVTGINLFLTASDHSGSVTSNATIVVSRNPPPLVSIPVSTQLPGFGAFAEPSTLLYHPSTAFNLKFDPGTFSQEGGSVNLLYYAITVDNTPLPSWISFDVATLSFNGETPPYASLIQPPQTFGIKLVASDVEGFSGASISFSLEVGVHLLVVKNTNMVMNVTVGVDAKFEDLLGNLELDGQQVDVSSLSSVIVQTPPWIIFDNTTLVLSGNPPVGTTPSNITVQVEDKYGDTVNATIYININTAIFGATIGTHNATIGSAFAYDFSTYLLNPGDTSSTIQLDPNVSWVEFDSQSFVLSGKVPSNIQALDIKATLQATSKAMQISDSESFVLHIASGPSPSPSSITQTTTSQTVTLTTSTPSESSVGDIKIPQKKSMNAIVVAIVVPLIGAMLLFLILLVAFLCYRKRGCDPREDHSRASKSKISAPLTESSSVVEIIRPIAVVAPEPLPLDTSGFGDESTSSVYTVDFNRRITPNNMERGIRRSQTMSIISDAPISDERHSEILGDRLRAYSETVASKNGSSRRSTQGSAYPNVRSRTNSSQMLTRNYSNYSRKGHSRRSGRVWSTDRPLQDGDSSTQHGEMSILNLRDSNFSFTPLDNFSALSASIPETSEVIPSIEEPVVARASRRQSKYISPIEQRAGISHGGALSVSSVTGAIQKRRSIGHGQNWGAGEGLTRDSRTWLTVNTADNERNRRSTSSIITNSTKTLERRLSTHLSKVSIKAVPKRPVSPALARMSESSVNSRPISRRIGSSPFFGGRSSSKTSKRSPKKTRTSFSDSPTVPEEEIMRNIERHTTGGLRGRNITVRDPFGISYGSTQEGTKHLRSYIQSHILRTKTEASMISSESKDSRFESANESMQSMHQLPNMQNKEKAEMEERHGGEGYENYLPDNYSEGSWESMHETQPNVVTYGPEDEDLEDVAIPAPLSLVRMDPNAPMLDIGANARIVSGKGKRPVSVDTKGMGSVRARVEHAGGYEDYTAYI